MDTNLIESITRNKTEERLILPKGGYLMIILTILIFLAGIGMVVLFIHRNSVSYLPIGIICIFISIISLKGFFTNYPNESIAVLLFGSYIGSIKESGFFWINPLTKFIRVSLKQRNFNGGVIKVNDKDGSPIEIAIIIVWKVSNTAQALFDVESYQNYLNVQSESAVRTIASSYPYDKHEENQPCLRGLDPVIIHDLITELGKKTIQAGISILDAKITHLAYSPEISNAMLKRQQAQAIIDARQKIINGAVGIVRQSIASLENMNLRMNDDQKANLVTNLLVVLCSESQVTPVVNTGYSNIV